MNDNAAMLDRNINPIIIARIPTTILIGENPVNIIAIPKNIKLIPMIMDIVATPKTGKIRKINPKSIDIIPAI